MRLIRDERGLVLVDYTPNDIGAASIGQLDALSTLVLERIEEIVTQTIDLEYLNMVVQNAINNRLTVGFLIDFEINAAGDIVYRGTDDKPNRLPIGTDGQVLKVASGLPIWGNDNSGLDTEIATATQAMSINKRYLCSLATLTTLTLPTVCPVGGLIQIIGAGSGGWKVTQSTGQRIHFGDKSTTLSTGSMNSLHAYDNISLICTTENSIFHATNPVGNINMV